MSRLVVLAWLCVAAVACGRRGTELSPTHAAAIADSVRQVLDAYTASVNRLDFEAALAYFADSPEFHWAETGRFAYPTYDSLAATFQALQPVITELALAWDDVRVMPLAPGAAVLTAEFRETFADTSGARTSLAGIVTIALRHEDEGWRFVAGHGSYVTPHP